MSERQTIRVPGYTPVQPIPPAARKGPLVMTGGIEGLDPKTEKMAETLQDQAALTFSNVERVIAAAGGSWADVVKLDFTIRSAEVRDIINEHWLRIFPDPDCRPARQVRISDALPPEAMLQCVATAWVD